MDAFRATQYYKVIGVVFWGIASVILSVILVIETVTCYRLLYSNKKAIEMMSKENTDTNKNQQVQQSSPSSTTNTTHSHAQSTTTSTNVQVDGLMLLMPILSYLFYWLQAIFAMMYTLNVLFEGCKFGGILSSICFAGGRLMVYTVLIYRIYTIYNDSTFAYNTKILIAVFIVLFVWTLINVIVNAFTGTEFKQVINDTVYCGLEITLPIIVSRLLLDFVSNVFCCYLFVRPLLKLSKINHGDESSKTNNQWIHAVIMKSAILTFVIVISTWIISIIIGVTKLTHFWAIDVIINCICIMFLKKQYHHYYTIICCGAIKISSHINFCKE
eukprot:49204_1